MLSELSASPTLSTLSPDDRNKLSLLFRTRGDAVSFAALREEDPLETLVWLAQPHIKPWHEAIQAAHREHEQTETRLSLARALRDITRILDLEADSKLRIRAVNAIIRLANAIHRSNPAAASPPRPSRASSAPSSPLKGASDGCRRVAAETQGSRGSPRRPSAPLVSDLRNLQHPSAVHEAAEPRRAQGNDETQSAPRHFVPLAFRPPAPIKPSRTPHLNSAHSNGAITTKAGSPRPPPRRKRY